ncbi:MAG: type VI secretion system protein TssA [Ramlibacter sp.]|nr:type VI secretion system protein TssA [Ramlibacter sp.]
MERERFAPETAPLLVSIASDAPCGVSLRYDPVFLMLRQAREEDDPTLPMGEWERPLKKADWRAIATQCSALLAARSKDFQLAAWLCEAWVHQHGIDGFVAAVEVLNGLVDQFWEDVHPRIEEGDADARVAPFVWMNDNLSMVLKLRVPLLMLQDRRPPQFSLAEWEEVVAGAPPRETDESDQPFTRESLIAEAGGQGLIWLDGLRESLEQAMPQWDALARKLDDKLALDAPSLGKVSDVLRKMHRACLSLMDGRSPRAATPASAVVAETTDLSPMPEETQMSAEDSFTEIPMQAQVSLPTGPISSRAEAYRLLEMAAEYLQRTEPHSPTPYLVKRAVTWGQMSLADLMQEIVREEGDLNRYFSLLGLNVPRD